MKQKIYYKNNLYSLHKMHLTVLKIVIVNRPYKNAKAIIIY